MPFTEPSAILISVPSTRQEALSWLVQQIAALAVIEKLPVNVLLVEPFGKETIVIRDSAFV